jgi:hypothetical protein
MIRAAIAQLDHIDDFTADGPTAADLADTETRQAEIEELFRAATESGTMDDALALKDEVLGEMEYRVFGYLQKGSTTEDELLTSVSAAIPEPLREVLPEQLKDALKPRSGPGAARGVCC